MKSKDFTWSPNFPQNKPKICTRNTGDILKKHTSGTFFCWFPQNLDRIILLLFLSLLYPTAFNIMVKLLRSTEWNDATTELNFLNKKVLVVSWNEFLCNCILCSCEGTAVQWFWVLYIMQLSLNMLNLNINKYLILLIDIAKYLPLKTVWKTYAGS